MITPLFIIKFVQPLPAEKCGALDYKTQPTSEILNIGAANAKFLHRPLLY